MKQALQAHGASREIETYDTLKIHKGVKTRHILRSFQSIYRNNTQYKQKYDLPQLFPCESLANYAFKIHYFPCIIAKHLQRKQIAPTFMRRKSEAKNMLRHYHDSKYLSFLC